MIEQAQRTSPPANEATYPDRHIWPLIEQYKLYVEMADRLTARRLLVNNSYITIMGAGAFAYSLTPQYFKGGFEVFFQLGITLACGILALMWRATIEYYRDLAAAKFRVINEIEALLPVQPYDREWKYLIEQKSGEGKKPFLTQSGIEMRVPLFAAAVSLCGFLYTFWELIRSLV